MISMTITTATITIFEHTSGYQITRFVPRINRRPTVVNWSVTSPRSLVKPLAGRRGSRALYGDILPSYSPQTTTCNRNDGDTRFVSSWVCGFCAATREAHTCHGSYDDTCSRLWHGPQQSRGELIINNLARHIWSNYSGENTCN